MATSSKLSNPVSTIEFVAANLTSYSCVLSAILSNARYSQHMLSHAVMVRL